MLWRCLACTTCYAYSLTACPHCNSTEREEEDGMPKTTVHEGPSYAGHVDVSGEDTAAPEWVPAEDAPAEPEPERKSEPEPVGRPVEAPAKKSAADKREDDEPEPSAARRPARKESK